MLTLYGHQGWGSSIIEAQLQWYGMKYHFEDAGDVFKDTHARRKLMTLNGVAQVPTVVFDDGQVMTESAAITLFLADLAKSDALVPASDHPDRARFLRWLVFIVANIYPTFTYVDDPGRFVRDAQAQEDFSNQVKAYRQRLWRMVESEAQRPWFLGQRFSALDLYVAVMNHWHPRQEWFEINAPSLHGIARTAMGLERIMPVFRKNFPNSEHWQS